ncbi:MAG: haloacid dehalogenase type II [Pseudomonadota bacterium]
MVKSISDFSVLTFDCYGTLIDWESGIWDALQPLFMANGFELPRQKALQAYAEIESAQQAETPGMLYPEILHRVHVSFAKRFDLQTNSDLNRAFGSSLPHWPAFWDTADALRILKKQFRLVILSNVNRDGFAASNLKLGVEFDAIYTAEDMGAYKPNPGNFEYMLSHLKTEFGLQKSDVLHTAQSLFHDHVPANSFSLATCWIDRQNLANSEDWGATAKVPQRPNVDFRFTSMMEMAEALLRAR